MAYSGPRFNAFADSDDEAAPAPADGVTSKAGLSTATAADAFTKLLGPADDIRRPLLLGWRPSLVGEAIAIRLEAIALRFLLLLGWRPSLLDISWFQTLRH